MILAALLHQAALELGMHTAVALATSFRPLVALEVAQSRPFTSFAPSVATPRLEREPSTTQCGCHYEYRYAWFCRPDGCQWVYQYVWVCN